MAQKSPPSGWRLLDFSRRPLRVARLGERDAPPLPGCRRLAQAQPPTLSSRSPARACCPHPTEALMASYPGGPRRPRETGRRLHSSHKMACGARASASCQPCPDFEQEGVSGQLWSGQSLTSPTQENIDRAFGAQRRAPGAYSLLPELPGHLLRKTLQLHELLVTQTPNQTRMNLSWARVLWKGELKVAPCPLNLGPYI